jgi:hypothetical protein
MLLTLKLILKLTSATVNVSHPGSRSLPSANVPLAVVIMTPVHPSGSSDLTRRDYSTDPGD